MARNYIKKKFIYWHSLKLNKKTILFLEADVALFEYKLSSSFIINTKVKLDVTK